VNKDFSIALTPLTETHTFKYGVWDIEAADWWNLLVIGVYDGKKYFHFTDISAFVEHILRREYRYVRWFAHFGGRYDLNFIFDWVRNNMSNIHCSFYCSGSMVLQMTLRRGDRVAKLCDSYRLLQGKLRDLGIAFGVKHQKTEMDFQTISYTKEMLEYNEQDCKCLYEVLETFFEQTGITSETFATHALRVWRKDYLKEKIWKPHEGILEFCRKSYHGGHVEVYKRGNTSLNAYDVNSMYPFVMLSPMPTDFIGENRKRLDNVYGFVQAVVRVPESLYIPPLPHQIEKLYFPSGELEGVWSTDELNAAEEKGVQVLKIIKAVYFECRPIFNGYVSTLYALKKKSGEPMRTIAKLLLNSLYGKFGQQPVKKVYMTEQDSPYGSYPILTPDGKPSGFAYFERRSNSAYLLPHIASAVTAKARVVLLKQLNESSYYCDTDSVFTSDYLPCGNAIGDWSLVGNGECHFVQPKLYKFNGLWKAKGLNKEQSIDEFVSGGTNHGKRSKSIKEALNTNTTACEHVAVDKVLRESRTKREWVGDDTRPWDIQVLMKGKNR
jgi:DNA polymerase type B, organellar and viral